MARWQQSPKTEAVVVVYQASSWGYITEGHTTQLLEGEMTERLNCLRFDTFGNAKNRNKEFVFCFSLT